MIFFKNVSVYNSIRRIAKFCKTILALFKSHCTHCTLLILHQLIISSKFLTSQMYYLFVRGMIQKYAEKCYIIFAKKAIPLILMKSDLWFILNIES